MKNIAEADKNLRVDTKIKEQNIVFYNSTAMPFKIHGLMREKGFARMPESVAKTVNDGVHLLSSNTSGGRVRFITNSPYVAINCKLPSVCRFPHMPLTGTTGFDMFADNGYMGTFIPPEDVQSGYESIIYLHDMREREIMINFPLYNDVSELFIGLEKTASVKEPKPYKFEIPIVYYGSSITQGGCASRAGNSYQAIISRKFDTDFINLGFSGSARAEDTIADYITSLKMSMLVFDYDYNAPNVKFLKDTHERFFTRIRGQNPELPIILVSKPDIQNNDGYTRREIIMETFNNAVKSGDKNVYFIDGEGLWKDINCCSVDTTHPNDYGFVCMAEKIGNVIGKILNRED